MTQTHWRRRLASLAFWTLLGLVTGVQYFLAEQRLAPGTVRWWEAFATALPASYAWGLLALLVTWLGRRFRLDRATFERHFVLHLGASLDVALIHLFAALGIQAMLHAAFRQPFRFGPMLVNDFTLFFHWNVLIYWAILAVVHAFDYHRDLEDRHRALAELEAQVRAAPAPTPTPASCDRLLVEHQGRRFFIRIGDIDWIEAARNYVRLHVGGKLHLMRSTLSALEQRLDQAQFRRISRSAIVNVDRVREIQPWSHGDAVMVLHSGDRLPLSRRFRRGVVPAGGEG